MTAEEFREEIAQALKRNSVDTDPEELRTALQDALVSVDKIEETEGGLLLVRTTRRLPTT